jgi:hypothetical protein
MQLRSLEESADSATACLLHQSLVPSDDRPALTDALRAG